MHNTYSAWEGLIVDIIDDSGKRITICNIDRPPRNKTNHVSIDSFLLDFSPVVQTLSKISKQNIVLAGDFNIDLLKRNSNSKYQEFYDTLSEFDFLPTNKNFKKTCNTHRSHVLQITKPTYNI